MSAGRHRAMLGSVPALALAGALLWPLSGCGPEVPPPTAAIEALGMQALQTREPGALAQLKRWSAAGSAVAARELGLALLARPERVAQGLAALRRAAGGGDAEAAYRLGEAQRQGLHGLQPDATAARPWLERAAALGQADAALSLAWLARAATPPDEASALRWLQAASRAGQGSAMFLLANAYAQGLGTPVDQAQARHWLKAAAERHHPAAMQALALALQDGSLGFERDAGEAQELLREAGEERHNRWRM